MAQSSAVGTIFSGGATHHRQVRYAYLQHCSRTNIKYISNKTYLPAVVYTVGAGPFWKCLVRFGYDPLLHPESRLWVGFEDLN